MKRLFRLDYAAAAGRMKMPSAYHAFPMRLETPSRRKVGLSRMIICSSQGQHLDTTGNSQRGGDIDNPNRYNNEEAAQPLTMGRMTSTSVEPPRNDFPISFPPHHEPLPRYSLRGAEEETK
jgi:hypothetical protein